MHYFVPNREVLSHDSPLLHTRKVARDHAAAYRSQVKSLFPSENVMNLHILIHVAWPTKVFAVRHGLADWRKCRRHTTITFSLYSTNKH